MGKSTNFLWAIYTITDCKKLPEGTSLDIPTFHDSLGFHPILMVKYGLFEPILHYYCMKKEEVRLVMRIHGASGISAV